MKPIAKTIIYVTLFSVAMGYMESVIVVYLRDLYYPNGFSFPLKIIAHRNAAAEFWRELATIIMLYTIGYLAGRNKPERFAFFIFSFAVWDIFYYVFLKLIIDWPASLLTWDILFLIPMPWVGPVLAPCLVSLNMILLSTLIIHFSEKELKANLIKRERVFIVSGCLIIVASFVKGYIYLLYSNHDFKIWTPLGQHELFADFMNYMPENYTWWLLGLGEIFILWAIFMYYKRQKKLAGSLVELP